MSQARFALIAAIVIACLLAGAVLLLSPTPADPPTPGQSYRLPG